MDDEFEDPDELDGAPVGLEAEEVVELLLGQAGDWRADVEVELGGERSWRPHLVDSEGKAVLYAHLSDRLRQFAERRLRLAFEAGFHVHVAIPESQLYNEELLSALVPLDAHIHVVTAAEELSVEVPERVLALLADKQLTVTSQTRTDLGTAYLPLCRQDGAPAHVRGKRFEALLAFLFAQIIDFGIYRRNFRTETEEIDIVVQQRATQGRCWAALMAPFVLVEAKNRADGISQEMVSVFQTKIKGKRGTVRLGFMCSTTTISSDALEQEFRFASEDVTIVFLDRRVLLEWIAADDGDAYLEDRVSRAMLR